MMKVRALAGREDPGSNEIAARPSERCDGCSLRCAELCHAICGQSSLRRCPPPLRQYEKGKLIAGRGESAGFLGVIRRGYVRRSEIRMNGQRVLFGLSVPGDIVGSLPGQASACDLEAATDLEICAFDASTLSWHLTGNRRLRQFLLGETDRVHHRFLQTVWRYGTLNSRERIIAFLVSAIEYMPTEPMGDGGLVLTMEIERRDVADLTNTAVETISRTLRHLESNALITCLSPSRFHIHDPDGLALLAGMDPVRRKAPDEGRRPARRSGPREVSGSGPWLRAVKAPA